MNNLSYDGFKWFKQKQAVWPASCTELVMGHR